MLKKSMLLCIKTSKSLVLEISVALIMQKSMRWKAVEIKLKPPVEVRAEAHLLKGFLLLHFYFFLIVTMSYSSKL